MSNGKSFSDLAKRTETVFRENQIDCGENEVTVISAAVHVMADLDAPTLKNLLLEAVRLESKLSGDRFEVSSWEDILEAVVQSCLIGTLLTKKDIASENRERTKRNRVAKSK